MSSLVTSSIYLRITGSNFRSELLVFLLSANFISWLCSWMYTGRLRSEIKCWPRISLVYGCDLLCRRRIDRPTRYTHRHTYWLKHGGVERVVREGTGWPPSSRALCCTLATVWVRTRGFCWPRLLTNRATSLRPPQSTSTYQIGNEIVLLI